jgi:hypothetical protein
MRDKKALKAITKAIMKANIDDPVGPQGTKVLGVNSKARIVD